MKYTFIVLPNGCICKRTLETVHMNVMVIKLNNSGLRNFEVCEVRVSSAKMDYLLSTWPQNNKLQKSNPEKISASFGLWCWLAIHYQIINCSGTNDTSSAK